MKKRECVVYLEPEEHVYIHKKTGEKFKSVTSVLSSLEYEFDSYKIAEAIENQRDDRKKERYIGLLKEEILSLWKEENDEANRYGTEIHEILERYLLNNKIYIPKNDYEREIILAYQEIDPTKSDTIFPEAVLFSEDHKLAGTSDLIEDYDDYFNVWDYKTNKEFNYITKYNKWLKPPVSHLSDCQYNLYSLQLSLYAYMYKKETNKRVGRLGIFWYNKNKKIFELIPISYMEMESKAVLDYWLENNK